LGREDNEVDAGTIESEGLGGGGGGKHQKKGRGGKVVIRGGETKNTHARVLSGANGTVSCQSGMKKGWGQRRGKRTGAADSTRGEKRGK